MKLQDLWNHSISFGYEYALMYFDNALQFVWILRTVRDLEVLHLFLQLTCCGRIGNLRKEKKNIG